MGSTTSDVVITADAHVGEPEALRRRMPKSYRDRMPRLVRLKDGNVTFPANGEKPNKRRKRRKPTPEDMMREFRDDPSEGTDLDRRLHDMALEGVDGQVIFPNVGLACSLGDEPAGYYHAWARAYNDFVWDVFGTVHDRFKPAAMLAVDDPKRMMAEAERCLKRGFASFFLPATVPWQPYRMPVYDPLWSLAAEADVPINFHIFSGNLAFRGDFASIAELSPGRYRKARAVSAEEDKNNMPEMVGISVVGMAAGMSPIVELCGSGVLQRHPDLKFVITESECGWLAWVLHAMDQMQERRYLGMLELDLKPSEYFHRQGFVSISDDPIALHNVAFTGTDCLLWGNDYPHDEGIFPHGKRPIAEIRDKLTRKQAHDILCGNAARLYGFDLKKLAATRDEVTCQRH